MYYDNRLQEGKAEPEQWKPYATAPASSQSDPLLPVTSHFLSAKALLRLRAFVSTYALGFMIFYIWNKAYTKQTMADVLMYFTNLTFFAEVAYVWVSTFHSFQFVYGRAARNSPPLLFVEFPFLLRLHAWLYSTVAVYHIVVPVLYWSVLSKELFDGRAGVGDIVGSIGTHAMDFAMMAIEVIFSRNVVRRSHWRVVAVVFCLYILLAFTNYWWNGWFVYAFADYTKSGWYFWYLAIAALLVMIFVAQMHLHRLRDRIGFRLARQRAESDDSFALDSAGPPLPHRVPVGRSEDGD